MTRAALLTLTVAWIAPCVPWHALATTRGHRSAVNMMARPKGASKAVRREQLLENMDSGPSRSKPDGKWEDDPSTPLALLAVRAGDARKAVISAGGGNNALAKLHGGSLVDLQSCFANDSSYKNCYRWV